MTHFPILVVAESAEEIKEQLYPFWELDLNQEELIADPRSEFDCEIKEGDEDEAFAKFLEEKDNQYVEKYGTPQEWIEGYHEYDYKEGVGWGFWGNPNKKWDWYEIGGRWSNYLWTKDGKRVDSCPKGEVDWKSMFAYHRGKLEVSWNCAKEFKDSARRYFEFGINKDDTEESYLNGMSRMCDFFVAIVKDKTWTQRHQVGWFATSWDENDAWETEFEEIWKSIPDDQWVTVVDCHI